MFELHTSDFDPCPARATLRREGRFDGVAGTALVRGLMIHSALELLHENEENATLDEILVAASRKTLLQMEEEGRMPSDAVNNNLNDLVRSMRVVLEHYERRVLPIVNSWTLLGVEIPVYWQLRDDVHLSSHIDAMFLTEEGLPIIWDWKWREKAHAAISDLSRSLQLACYWALVAGGEGVVQLKHPPKGWFSDDEGWSAPADGSPIPKVAWVDLPSLKPYSRATLGKDEEGRAVQFVKGDDRPISKIIRYVNMHPSNIDKIKASALFRADMIINGTAPFIPQGCSHCECEAWCPRFDMFEKEV